MRWCPASQIRCQPVTSLLDNSPHISWWINLSLCLLSFLSLPWVPSSVYPILVLEGTLTGLLSCWEERLQFSCSVTVCFHSFLRFSSCPRKQCTDTLCANLNHVQNKGLGGAGRCGECSLSCKMEQMEHDMVRKMMVEEQSADSPTHTWPSTRLWAQASSSSLSKCQEYQTEASKHWEEKQTEFQGGLMLHFYGCRVDRFHQKGCYIWFFS